MTLCDRCGREGNDRRTLWMSCLAKMDEPQHIGRRAPPYREEFDGTRWFYRLTVCKTCRSSWMESINFWFYSQTKEEDA